jgi:Tripartite tricarboxylate transporter family receptor
VHHLRKHVVRSENERLESLQAFFYPLHFGLPGTVEYTPTSHLLSLEVAILPAAGAFAFAKRDFSACPKMHKPASLIFSVISCKPLRPSPPSPHAGTGGPTHIAGLLLQKETGTRFQFVPYRGGAAQYIQDLVAGQIDLAFSDPIAALPQVNAGTIKAYGVTTKARLRSAPDIPTLDEAGLPGFDISLWQGLWLPKGTPRDIIAKLNAAVVEALADPALA